MIKSSEVLKCLNPRHLISFEGLDLIEVVPNCVFVCWIPLAQLLPLFAFKVVLKLKAWTKLKVCLESSRPWLGPAVLNCPAIAVHISAPSVSPALLGECWLLNASQAYSCAWMPGLLPSFGLLLCSPQLLATDTWFINLCAVSWFCLCSAHPISWSLPAILGPLWLTSLA